MTRQNINHSNSGGHSAPTTGTPFIHTLGLTHQFDDREVLSGIDLTIAPGETVAIMGPSGSGKSTLLHCLSGVLQPTSGEVWLAGHRIDNLSDAKRSHLRLAHCGFVFQDGQLIPELTLRENVALPMMLSGTSRRSALKQADETLTKLGLADFTKKRPGNVSGGQSQRTAIARAVASSPSVIFADEPTGALDQTTGHEAMQLLTTIARMSGATLVLVTHDLTMAKWCGRMVEIRDGIIHADYPLTPADNADDGDQR